MRFVPSIEALESLCSPSALVLEMSDFLGLRYDANEPEDGPIWLETAIAERGESDVLEEVSEEEEGEVPSIFEHEPEAVSQEIETPDHAEAVAKVAEWVEYINTLNHAE